MHSLGIPTTRSGSCVTSDSYVTRDLFYTGNIINERCAVISRIAPTFIRFGSFEIFKETDSETGRQGPSHGRKEILQQLADYVIETFYPQIWSVNHQNPEQMHAEFFREVCIRTARLVARWQCVGFCHGVLNTDNMSIVGLTIDYGPYGFLDRYDPDFICNASDEGGRYTYRKQPEICRWNCGKLAEALQPILPLSVSQELLKEFDDEFQKEYWGIMRRKFGFFQLRTEDREIMESFLQTMYRTGADFTNSFRILSHLRSAQDRDLVLNYLLDQCCSAREYKRAFSPQTERSELQTLLILQTQNPEFLSILGKKAKSLQREMELMEKPGQLKNFTNETKKDRDRKMWTTWLAKYLQRVLQESSSDERVTTMDTTNPRIVLRNYIAQNAIEAADKGDFMEVRRVLKAFENPFDSEVRNSEGTGFDEAIPGPLANVAGVDDDRKSDNPWCSGPSKKCRIEYDIKAPEERAIRVS